MTCESRSPQPEGQRDLRCDWQWRLLLWLTGEGVGCGVAHVEWDTGTQGHRDRRTLDQRRMSEMKGGKFQDKNISSHPFFSRLSPSEELVLKCSGCHTCLTHRRSWVWDPIETYTWDYEVNLHLSLENRIYLMHECNFFFLEFSLSPGHDLLFSTDTTWRLFHFWEKREKKIRWSSIKTCCKNLVIYAVCVKKKRF